MTDETRAVTAITPSVLSVNDYDKVEAIGRAHMLTDTRMTHEPSTVETWDHEKDADLIAWLKTHYPDVQVVEASSRKRWGRKRNERHIDLPAKDYQSGMITEIVPRLFVAGLFTTHKTDRRGRPFSGELNDPTIAAQITHIIHIHDDDDPCSGKIFDHDLVFNLTECGGACKQMMAALPTCLKYIHRVLQEDANTRILVHCYAGKNRSVTIIAAYLLVAGYCQHADEALHYICARHPNASPMEDFVHLLSSIAILKPMLSELILLS